jgi:hypothetical protein
MEGDTPKFCETKETNINLKNTFSFSVVYEKSDTKPNHHYHSQHNSSHKSKKGHKKKHSKNKSKFRKMKVSQQDRIKCKSDKYNLEYNKITIEEFFIKHRFKLSNNFDQKHSEKFLISKEEAFEKPFVQLEKMNKKPILC